MYLYAQRSPSLAGYRPNQAMRTVYAGYTSPSPSGAQLRPINTPQLGAFGDATDPTTWLVGAAALGGLWLLFRRRGSGDKRKIARLSAQRALASRSLREEGV